MHRDMTGAGQYVEVPQVEAAMHFIGEHILHAMATGVDPVPQGNRVSWAAPHDTFPARGDDQWIAIAVTDDAAWRALCAAIGAPDLAADPRFATLPDRLRHQDELIGPIAAWTRPRDKHEAARILQRAGVMAAPVQDAKDVVNSAYLAERGYFRELDHIEAGRHRHSGLPFHLSLTPGGMERAAPCLGQHTHMILREILRLPEAEIERLERAGTITNLPAY
jgi:crotonobetainyl-CoA:carnitine CoA-transferase CaiB-like acyl-CoA transferase